MVINKFDNAQMFLDLYEELMLQNEAVSQLILYDAYQNLTVNADEKCVFGSAVDNDRVFLLFCNVAPYNLVVYMADQEELDKAAKALADYIFNSHIPITGINAKNELCHSFMEQYIKKTDCVFKERFGMDIMEVRKLIESKPSQGNHRNAIVVEAKTITDWIIQYQMEAMASEMDYEEALKMIVGYIEEQKIYVYETDNQIIVSMAIVTRQLPHGIAIGYVYTPEEYRGKGYAASNIYFTCKHYLENGYDYCSLFADKNCTLSHRAYEKVGFQTLEDHHDYMLIHKPHNTIKK